MSHAHVVSLRKPQLCGFCCGHEACLLSDGREVGTKMMQVWKTKIDYMTIFSENGPLCNRVHPAVPNEGAHNHDSITTQETNGYNQSTWPGMSGRCIRHQARNMEMRGGNEVRLENWESISVRDLKNIFWQAAVILLCDLRLIQWPVKQGWIVIHIFDMNDNGGVVLIPVVRCHKSELILYRQKPLVKEKIPLFQQHIIDACKCWKKRNSLSLEC